MALKVILVRLLLFILFITSCERKFVVEMPTAPIDSSSLLKTSLTNWIKQLGTGEFGANVLSTSGGEEVSDMAQDKDGNIIVVGNTPVTLCAAQTEDSHDGFILKIDSNGEFLWCLQLSDDQSLINESNGFEWLYSVATDNEGNIFVTGETYNSFIESNGGTSDSDIFLIKISPEGVILWAKQFGDTSVPNSSGAQLQEYAESLFPGFVVDTENYDYVRGITTDSLGYIYIAAGTSGDWIGTNGGSIDALMIKLDPLGDIVWVRQISSEYNGVGDIVSSAGSQVLEDVAVDNLGNVYATTKVMNNFAESASLIDCAVVKFSKFGNLLWAKQLGGGSFGTTNASNTSGVEYCTEVAVDSNQNVYVAGATSGSLNEANGGADDVFVMKLTSDGNFEWLNHFGDHEAAGMGGNLNNTDARESVNALYIDSNDKIYVAGSSIGAIGEGNDTSREDSFVISMNSDSSFNWIKHVGSGSVGASLLKTGLNTDDHDNLFGLVVDSSGNVIGAGHTYSSMGEDSSGDYDVYIFKMEQ